MTRGRLQLGWIALAVIGVVGSGIWAVLRPPWAMVNGDMAILTGSRPRVGAVAGEAHPQPGTRVAQKTVGPRPTAPPATAINGFAATPTSGHLNIGRGEAITPGKVLTGSGGWFGGLDDPIDPGITASGIPESRPGMATYYQSTLGGYWRVTAPNGRTVVLQQTDVGPAPWTGRVFDFTYSALPELGYTEADIPTGIAHFSALYLGDNPNTPPRLLEPHP